MEPREDLEEAPLPTIHINAEDLTDVTYPAHDVYQLFGFVDSEFATCPKTRRSFTGGNMQLAGATVAYNTRLQPTVAMCSTEAVCMAARDAGKISLFVRSILYDLEFPQEAATILYEDNEGAIGMSNMHKWTTV